MAWDDAPPSPSELISAKKWDEEAPTAEELAAMQTPSLLRALGRGAGQGATLGFADEMAGALESPSGALESLAKYLNLPTIEKDIPAYQKERDAARQINERAKTAHPYGFGAGEILGGTGLGAATGGFGGLGAVASDASLAARMAGGIEAGATLGAVSGVGTSNELENAPKSALVGAASGATVGAAMPVAGAALGKIGGAIGSVIPDKFKTAFQLGKEGINLSNEAGRRQVIDTEQQNVVEKLANQIKTGDDSLAAKVGGEFGAVKDQNANTSLNVEPAVEKAQSLINQLAKEGDEGADRVKLQTLLDRYVKEKPTFSNATEKPSSVGSDVKLDPTSLTPVTNPANDLDPLSLTTSNAPESLAAATKGTAPNPTETIFDPMAMTSRPVRNLTEIPFKDVLATKKSFQGVSEYGNGMSSKNGKNIAGLLAKEFTEPLETIPEMATANAKYNTLQEDVLNPLGLKGKMNKAEAANALRNKVFGYEANSNQAGSNIRADVEQALVGMEKLDPELAKSVRNLWSSTSKRIQVAKDAGQGGAVQLSGVPGVIKSQSTQLVNAAGRGAGAISKSASNALGVTGKFLNSMPLESLRAIGQKLQASQAGTSQKLGNILSAAAEKDQIGRNALIFTVMQNPDYRNLIQQTLGLGD